MSIIFYKFRSGREFSKLPFDGLTISVQDLKEEILKESHLNADEFDLVISNSHTNEDYTSLKTQVPKGTYVLVRRVPRKGPKPSAGYGLPPAASNSINNSSSSINASTTTTYPSNAGVNKMGFSSTSAAPTAGAAPASGGGAFLASQGHSAQFLPGLSSLGGQGTHGDQQMGSQGGFAANSGRSGEADSIEAMFQNTQRPVFSPGSGKPQRPGGFQPHGRHNNRPEHHGPPPPNYICHRCAVAGHWIYDCPTQYQQQDGDGANGASADSTVHKKNEKRVRPTTGIPKSFLQSVDKLEDGKNALITSDGKLVVATANELAWQSSQKFTRKTLPTDMNIDVSKIPDELKCPICSKLLNDASRVPCCKTTYCSECIDQALLRIDPEFHFVCPSCKSPGVVPDAVVADDETRRKVGKFLSDYIESEKSKEQQQQQEQQQDQQDNTGVNKEENDGSTQAGDKSSTKTSDSHISAISRTVRSATSSNYNNNPTTKPSSSMGSFAGLQAPNMWMNNNFMAMMQNQFAHMYPNMNPAMMMAGATGMRPPSMFPNPNMNPMMFPGRPNMPRPPFNIPMGGYQQQHAMPPSMQPRPPNMVGLPPVPPQMRPLPMPPNQNFGPNGGQAPSTRRPDEGRNTGPRSPTMPQQGFHNDDYDRRSDYTPPPGASPKSRRDHSRAREDSPERGRKRGRSRRRTSYSRSPSSDRQHSYDDHKTSRDHHRSRSRQRRSREDKGDRHRSRSREHSHSSRSRRPSINDHEPRGTRGRSASPDRQKEGDRESSSKVNEISLDLNMDNGTTFNTIGLDPSPTTEKFTHDLPKLKRDASSSRNSQRGSSRQSKRDNRSESETRSSRHHRDSRIDRSPSRRDHRSRSHRSSRDHRERRERTRDSRDRSRSPSRRHSNRSKSPQRAADADADDGYGFDDRGRSASKKPYSRDSKRDRNHSSQTSTRNKWDRNLNNDRKQEELPSQHQRQERNQRDKHSSHNERNGTTTISIRGSASIQKEPQDTREPKRPRNRNRRHRSGDKNRW
ncbi:Retinoblastoma-binding protein [Mycoemilia scoparia]|uniref:Retinoblastoma-binding protein n=1 Tax=Mycoemilia scoparia TaxID=417184 RepID=A0A9W7ZTS8_9FUNG|nr:Retinoblastoma-binding protein [Mycoemilia scoparia]